MNRQARYFTTLMVLVLTAAGAMAAGPYEEPADRRPSQVLPKEMVAGRHYRVQDPVVADGYMYRFTVKSDYGPFEVTGIGALRKLLNEIRAIAKLEEIKNGKAFAAAVADSASGPFRFAKNLIVHPVDTLSGVPSGAYKLMENAAEAVSTERNPSDDPAYKKLLLVSGRKRDYAAQLNVDPYSSNPVLQKELNRVAWAAALGNLTVSAALMPVGGAAGAVVSSTRFSNALNDYLKAEPASQLRIINDGKLTAMGIPPDVAKRFLDQPHFSPRHQTILVEALARLGTARGRENFLEIALGAEDEVDANFFTNAAQIMRGYHETMAPISELQVLGRRLTVAQAANGNALIPLPLDYIIWTQTPDQRSQDVKAKYGAPGFNGRFDLWLTGMASPLAKQRLAERGMTVVEEVYKRVEIID